jgi:hypothetical protein
VDLRKNQKGLTPAEWKAFTDAITSMHGIGTQKPAYRDFVSVHATAMGSMQGMSWHVHTMRMGGVTSPGTNFFAWHRQFVRQFELRLQKASPNLTVPYWDWANDPQIPAALSGPALLSRWSVKRGPSTSAMPTKAEQDAVMGSPTFRLFQSSLESGIHGEVHNAVGGDMASASSPNDPLFWLHHANIDRLWSMWQTAHPGQDPANLAEKLQPSTWKGSALFGVTVQSVLNINAMNYQYA